MKSVAPLGIVPNLKAGLEEVGLERRESWTNRRRELMQLTTYPPITAHLDPREVEELLPGDHEGGEVGGVDGEEHHREQRPDRGHEPVTCVCETEDNMLTFFSTRKSPVIREEIS